MCISISGGMVKRVDENSLHGFSSSSVSTLIEITPQCIGLKIFVQHCDTLPFNLRVTHATFHKHDPLLLKCTIFRHLLPKFVVVDVGITFGFTLCCGVSSQTAFTRGFFWATRGSGRGMTCHGNSGCLVVQGFMIV